MIIATGLHVTGWRSLWKYSPIKQFIFLLSMYFLHIRVPTCFRTFTSRNFLKLIAVTSKTSFWGLFLHPKRKLKSCILCLKHYEWSNDHGMIAVETDRSGITPWFNGSFFIAKPGFNTPSLATIQLTVSLVDIPLLAAGWFICNLNCFQAWLI